MSIFQQFGAMIGHTAVAAVGSVVGERFRSRFGGQTARKEVSSITELMGCPSVRDGLRGIIRDAPLGSVGPMRVFAVMCAATGDIYKLAVTGQQADEIGKMRGKSPILLVFGVDGDDTTYTRVTACE